MKRLFLTLAMLFGLVACQSTQVREDAGSDTQVPPTPGSADDLAAQIRAGTERAVEAFAAATQSADLLFERGSQYYQGRGVPQDYAEAARWFRKAAEQGEVGAQTQLGFMYEKGQGVPQDYAEAARWYRKAVEQGDAKSQFNFGVMYFDGKGVPQDHVEAMRWVRKAAEQGLAVAQFNLGGMHVLGRGVSRNYIMTYMWLKLAAAQGHEQAQSNRDRVANKMTPAQIAEAQRLAREWKPKLSP